MPAPEPYRTGRLAAGSALILLLAYAVSLGAGFWSLESPDQPIGDPFFTALEILILMIMPALVVLMAAVHAWAPPRCKVFSAISAAFMAMTAATTCLVHFAILTLSRRPEFAGPPWQTLVFPFRWPSVVYALDILAWDFFFALAMLFAVPVFHGRRPLSVLAATSGVLSLAGLAGAATGNMALRNIGIAGYLVVFFALVVLLYRLFSRPISPEPQSK